MYPLIVERESYISRPQRNSVIKDSVKKRSSFHFGHRGLRVSPGEHKLSPHDPRMHQLNSLKSAAAQAIIDSRARQQQGVRKLSAPCFEESGSSPLMQGSHIIHSFPQKAPSTHLESPETQLTAGSILTISRVSQKKNLRHDTSLLQRFQICESMRSLIDEAQSMQRQRSIIPQDLCTFHRQVFLLIMKYLKTKKLDSKLHEVLLAPWRKARGADLQYRQKQEILKRFFLGVYDPQRARQPPRQISPKLSPTKKQTVLLKKTPEESEGSARKRVDKEMWNDVDDAFLQQYIEDDSVSSAHRAGLYQFKGGQSQYLRNSKNLGPAKQKSSQKESQDSLLKYMEHQQAHVQRSQEHTYKVRQENVLRGLRDFNRITNYHKNLIYFLMRTQSFPKDAFLAVLREIRLHINFHQECCPYCVISSRSHKAGTTKDAAELGQLALSPSGNDLFFKTFQEQKGNALFLQNSLIVNKKHISEKYHSAQPSELNQRNQPFELKRLENEAIEGKTLYGWYQMMSRNPESVIYKHISPEQLMLFSKFEQSVEEMKRQTEISSKARQRLDPVPKAPSRPKKQPLKKLQKKTPESMYRKFLSKISLANGLKLTFPDGPITPPYRFFIGRGNNSIVVKQALKQRWWWAPNHDADSWESYNFIWTQWKSMSVLDTFTTHRQFLEEGGNSGSCKGEHTPKSSSSKHPLHTPKGKGLNHTNSTSSLTGLGSVCSAANTTGSSSNFNNKRQKGASPEKETPVKTAQRSSHRLYNRLESNYHLANKKALFYNLREYYRALGEDIFDNVPVTFHIREGARDKEFTRFLETYQKYKEEGKKGSTHWIVKPGENTNRGFGIKICSDLQSVREVISNTVILLSGKKRSYIVQRYITNPFLYKGRKFDIRCFALVTSTNGNMRAYWYKEGYLRTSSRQFSLRNGSKMVHLTNDAVQKRGEDYGKFESGNKLSYADIQKYIDTEHPKSGVVFLKDVLPGIKKIAQDTIKCAFHKMDPHRRHHCFEILGYDFMIDEHFKPWLIEVNTNPCLEISSPLLARMLPAMIENSLKIAVDPLFPPPPCPPSKKPLYPQNPEEANKFELMFDESTDGAQLLKMLPKPGDVAADIIEEEILTISSESDEEEEMHEEETEDIVY